MNTSPHGMWLTRAAVLIGVSVLGAGCGGTGQEPKTGADGVTRRDTRIVHEDCDVKSGEKIDANADNRPDITIVKSGGREVCRAVDLNFDGVVDAWVYRDPSGQIRRRETDYDRDGRVDEIAVYQAGVVLEKRRATTLSNKLDTWQFYRGGTLARAERDADGDQIVDQWWEFPKPGCPMIHSDVDGDGRPDPGATINYCKETGFVPADRQPYRTPTSPDFQKPGALPTEVENKEMAPDTEKASPASGAKPSPGATPASGAQPKAEPKGTK